MQDGIAVWTRVVQSIFIGVYQQFNNVDRRGPVQDALGKPILYDVVDKEFFSNTTECLEAMMRTKENKIHSGLKTMGEKQVQLHRSIEADMFPQTNI
jgi:hypothetical protein